MRIVCALTGLAGILLAFFGCSETPQSQSQPQTKFAPSRPVIGPEKDGGVRFVDIGESAGLVESFFNAANGQFRLIETMGGGIGLIDYDRDGLLDIFVLQGCPLPYQPIAPGEKRAHARLHRNLGQNRFEDVTDKAKIGFDGFGQGVAVGDYDGDGWDDLYISAFGEGALYRNLGDGSFNNMTGKAKILDRGWGTSCAFADLDSDGDLDLFVAHYLGNTVDAQGQPTVNCNAVGGKTGYCPPQAFEPEADALFRNNGDGTFTDVSRDSGVAAIRGCGLGVAIADWDDDGKLDIFVANDQMPNFLYHNQGQLKFEETAVAWGLAYNEAGHTQAGMGVAAGDYDRDGRSDLLVTNFFEETNTLYRNVSPKVFTVGTREAKLAAPSRGVLGFGAQFADFDNDGWLDLFVANGHINDVRPLGMPYHMPAQLFQNTGQGQFQQVSRSCGLYFQKPWLGRSAAVGDLNNDGLLDCVVSHLERAPAVLSNQTSNQARWIGFELDSAKLGQGPTGARLELTVDGVRHYRESIAGTSYLASSDRRLHFGLGQSQGDLVLVVRWLTGKTQTFRGLTWNRYHRISESSDKVTVLPSVKSP